MPTTTGVAANVAALTFQTDTLTPEDLRVVELEGREAISELFAFRLVLTSELPAISLEEQVGKHGRLRLLGMHGERCINGMIRRFERLGDAVNQALYAVELVPKHWLLTRRQACRIFQQHNCEDMSVPGIIKKVFADAGMSADHIRWALKQPGQYQPRDYVVQYRETDFAFISRLMEEEGIFYFFEHSEEGHKMVIGNDPSAHAQNPAKDTFRYRALDGGDPPVYEDMVYRMTGAKQIQYGAVCLDDFNFQDPELDLTTRLAAKEFSQLEWSNYPDHFTTRQEGNRYAQLRLEEQTARMRQFDMQTRCRILQAGYRLTIVDHPTYPDFNRDYVVLTIEHRAKQGGSLRAEAIGVEFDYQPTVTLIDAKIPFRPPLKTPRPVVHGSQTAIVVGPQGEEIYTDKFGRVKAQFHWDREGVYNENSSCWIRVSQSMAGGGYGALFLPRVGQEVIVDFLEGNPDRPIIVGRVYNADHMPGYALPDNKTRSSIKSRSSKGGAGGNEIRFEDLKDNEQFLLHAMRDFHLRTKRDKVEIVERDEHMIVERNIHKHVKQNEHVEVTLDQKVKIGGKVLVQIKGDRGETITGNVSADVKGDHYLNAKGKIVIESATGITLKCGGNFVKIDSSGVTIVGTQVKINSGGSADSGTLVATPDPEAPLVAEEIEYGQDKTYNRTVERSEPPPPEERKKTSWIEIEMVDEAGQPWPYEPFEILTPEGRKLTGALDANGMAHVHVPTQGTCQICFPRLDKDAWERIG